MTTRARLAIAIGALTMIVATPAQAQGGGDGEGGGQGSSPPIRLTPRTAPEALLGGLRVLTGVTIADAATNPETGSQPPPITETFGTGPDAPTAEANTLLSRDALESEYVVRAAGVSSVAKVTAQVCPDQGGHVSAHITFSRVTTATGANHEISARANGVSNDNAELTSLTVDVVAGKGAEAKLLEKSGREILRNAEQGWRNGYCVKIDVSEGQSRSVKPKEQVPIAATATPRFGGGKITGNMHSKKTAGQKQVKPAQASGSPAKFTYTAPDKEPETGSVELKSVSKRGIAIANLEYTTEGDLKIEAPLSVGLWTLSATKCGGPVGDWKIAGTASGIATGSESITVKLSKGSLSGPWHSTGKVSAPGAGTIPINESGNATYSRSRDGTSGTLTFEAGQSVPVTVGTFCKEGKPPGG